MPHCELGALSEELQPLLELLNVFERWYAGMGSLKTNNDHLYQNSLAVFSCMEDLYQVSTQAQGALSNPEIEHIYARAKTLCNVSQTHIAKSELLATVTFQDIQATCHMILTQVHNLQALVKQLEEKAQVDEDK